MRALVILALGGLLLGACREEPSAPAVNLEQAVLRVDDAGAVLVEGLGAPQRLIEGSQGAVALFSPDRRYVALAHAPFSNLSVCEAFAWQTQTGRYEAAQNLSTLAWGEVAEALGVSIDEIMSPRCLPVRWHGPLEVELELTGRGPEGDRLTHTLRLGVTGAT